MVGCPAAAVLRDSTKKVETNAVTTVKRVSLRGRITVLAFFQTVSQEIVFLPQRT